MTQFTGLFNGFSVTVDAPEGKEMPKGMKEALTALFKEEAPWIIRKRGDATPTEGFVEWVNSQGMSGRCACNSLSWDEAGHPVVQYRFVD